MMSNSSVPSASPYPSVTQPATNFSRSAAMSARIFLPQALRRLSASSSEYPANFWATRMTDSW